MNIKMIACIGRNNELGVKNQLIWRFREDMQFFRKYTEDKVVVMGRKTYDSLPHKPLPNRENVVITHNPYCIQDKDVIVCTGIDEVFELYGETEDSVIIIGGETIYRQFLPYATELVLTEVNSDEPSADTFFPQFRNNFVKEKELLKTNGFVINKYVRTTGKSL